MRRQPSSHNTAIQDATTESRHPFAHIGHNIHNTVTDELPGRPIAIGQCLQRSASTSPRAEQHHLPRESPHRHPACHHRVLPHICRSSDSLVYCRPTRLGSGAPSIQPKRSEEIRARALLLSRLNGMHERSIALVELRYDEMLLPQRLVVGHTTKQPHGNLVHGITTLKNTGVQRTHCRPLGTRAS
ncbi:hypothetical protein IG631_23341 [Alternaria alternata]|nr:hypothetical protein IG631_23341 [Alternaria alternata]